MNSSIKLFVVMLVLVGLLCLHGCATIEPQPKVEVIEVFKPRPTLPELPPELANPVVAAMPTFVAPDDPKAVAALTQDQTLIFKRWMMSLKAQLIGFRALFAQDEIEPEAPPELVNS